MIANIALGVFITSFWLLTLIVLYIKFGPSGGEPIWVRSILGGVVLVAGSGFVLSPIVLIWATI